MTIDQLITLSEPADGGFNIVWIIAIYALFFGAIYFFFFRPQSKKRKKEAEMKRNAQVGDEITTIGGISGRIVAVKEETDSLILETGADKTKIKLKRWAVGSVDTVHEETEA